MTHQNVEDQHVNPFHLPNNSCCKPFSHTRSLYHKFICHKILAEVVLTLNGRAHTQIVNSGVEQSVHAYYNNFKTLASRLPFGRFPLTRKSLEKGLFMCSFDLTRSGTFALQTLDTMGERYASIFFRISNLTKCYFSFRNPSMISVALKFEKALTENYQVHTLVYSTAKTVINDDDIMIELI